MPLDVLDVPFHKPSCWVNYKIPGTLQLVLIPAGSPCWEPDLSNPEGELTRELGV